MDEGEQSQTHHNDAAELLSHGGEFTSDEGLPPTLQDSSTQRLFYEAAELPESGDFTSKEVNYATPNGPVVSSYSYSTETNHSHWTHEGDFQHKNRSVSNESQGISEQLNDQHDVCYGSVNNSGTGNPNGDPPPQLHLPYSTRCVWLSVTLIIVCYVISFIPLIPICTQYFSYRIGRDKYNVTFNSTGQSKCVNSTHEDEIILNKIQTEASNTILYASLASGIPAIFVCLFIGSYSDYLGRRPLLLASILGGMVKVMILCLIVKLDLDIWVFYLGSLVDGLLGSFYNLTLASCAVIADITPNPKNRAVNFAITEGILFVSAALAQLAVGYLIKEVGFFPPVLACACAMFVGLLLTLFVLPETIHSKRQFQWNPVPHLRKVFGFYFFDGTRRRRTQFAIGLIMYMNIMLTNLGRMYVETLYVLNAPICWDSLDIGIFHSLRLAVMSVVAVIVLKLLKPRLSLELSGMLCSLSSIAGFIMEGFATSTKTMYLSALVGILYMAVSPVPRALLSQITPPTEQGALFSSLSSIETVSSMTSSAVYTLIYNATLSTFKGAVFMFMSGLCFITFVLLGSFRCVRGSQPPHYEYSVGCSKINSIAQDKPECRSVSRRNSDIGSDETKPLLEKQA